MPAKDAGRRLAVVGEAPGSDEVAWHICTRCGEGYAANRSYNGGKCPTCSGIGVHAPTPFVGQSGRLLNKLLAEVGIEREACWVGNVCQVQPPRNEIKAFKWDGPEIQGGLEQVRLDLNLWKPHMVLLLGNTPLRAFNFEQPKCNVGDWRGSLFIGGLHNGLGVKCMATYHPAAVLRDPALSPLVRFDLKRLAAELAVDGIALPKRDIVIAHPDEGWTAERIVQWCEVQRELRTPLSVDLEGVVDYIECIGFATCPDFALVVPFISVAGESVWSEADEYAIWLALEGLLSDPDVPKILTNALYDAFVLAWTYGIVVRPIVDDTMLKWHELYCELEKSLAMQTSVLTREPFYKFQRKQAQRLHEAASEAATTTP